MENIIVITKPELQQLIIEAVISVIKSPNASGSQPLQTNYLSTEEAALRIKKSPGALRQIVHRGEIPSIKRGNSLLFLEDDLTKWIEKGRRDATSFEDPVSFLKKRGSK